MSNGWGVRTLSTLGRPLRASAGEMIPKAGGVTIDWTKVTAVASTDKTLTDDQVVKVGEKYIRYGTVLCRIQTAEVQTITMVGSPSGGTFKLGTTLHGAAKQTTANIDYDATAAELQAALEALSNVHIGDLSVTLNGAVYTVTFNYDIGDAPLFTLEDNSLTGNGDEDVTFAATTAGANTGKFAPYDATQTDGRQVLRSGDCFVLDETVIDSEEHSDYPNAVFDAGLVFKDRVLNNSDDLLTNPTEAAFHTAFPGIRFVTS